MKFRITVTATIIMIASIAFGLACGGASAPPVDLPAPITGRVDVSAPDANGNVTITGTDGAVSGGAMVMAVNETVAGAQALEILSALIPSAWAQVQDFPSVCSETGHACDEADANGAFVITLAASIGDSIVVGVINAVTGEFISELFRETVDVITATCLGVTGTAVDIALIPANGTPIILKQGSETARNQIVIGVSSKVTHELSEGCSAHSIAAIAASSNTSVIAVTSKDDKKLWTGTYNLTDQTFSGENVFTLEHEPMDIIFLDDFASAIVAIKDSSSVFLQKISLSDGSAQLNPVYPEVDNTVVTGLTRGLRLDVTHVNISEGHTEQHLALAATDNGTSSSSYITLFDADRMSHLGSWPASTWSGSGLQSIKDAAFWVQGSFVRMIAISDDARGAVLGVMWTVDGFMSYEVSTAFDLTSAGLWLTVPSITATASSFSFTPVNVVVSDHVQISDSVAPPTALITSASGEVYLLPLTGFAEGLTTNAVLRTVQSGSTFSAIAVDDGSRSVYVAEQASGETAVENLSWSN